MRTRSARAVTADARGPVPRPGPARHHRLLRLLALPVLSLLFLAGMLPAPAPAAAASKYGDARLDQWSWLTTHNSYAYVGALPPRNQSRSVVEQLDDGVRGLMFDTYDKVQGDPVPMKGVTLCHSIVCYNLFEVEFGRVVDFLKKNPQEVVTIFLENYASQETLTKAIAEVLEEKNATDLLFQPSEQGFNIDKSNWPRVRNMVARNERLVIFQDKWADDIPVTSRSNADVEYGRLMYTWKRTVETTYDYDGNRPSGCLSRNNNKLDLAKMPGTNLTPLFTINQFDSSVLNPESKSHGDNGQSLKNRVEKDCRDVAKREPNYVAVNFHQHSDTPGVTPLSVVDGLNRNAVIIDPHQALWTVSPSKQYVSTIATNRCMVRGDEFEDGQGGLVTQRNCANPAPSSHQWSATPPTGYDGKGFRWIKAGNGSCLTVPYNNGTPPGNDTQLFWWPCETRWFSGSQLWNVIPAKQQGGPAAFYFVNQWTGKCLTLDIPTSAAKAGKVTQAACPKL
ncbi:phosphatidylinositol-specific phospholipase C domain-containing protein [Streptomyces lavendulocolor]|uniref:phosphatidylinositol-specific phospholipase C domain-containing protein n=1 Tax=Streptomyces lavendulocolor TaxID=67316 RepID=UPI003C2B1C2D